MDIATLLAKLNPLLSAPENNLDDILKLLHKNDRLAEYEVARFVVAEKVRPFIDGLLTHLNEEKRRQGLDCARLLLGRSQAASIIRRSQNDVNPRVRRAAQVNMLRLHLDNAQPTEAKKQAKKGKTKAAPKKTLDFPANEKDLLAALSLPNAAALRPLIRAGSGRGAPYVDFEIPKRTGGMRKVSAPRAKLKKAQQVILHKYLDKAKVHDACHGFVSKRSIVTNAAQHVKSAVIVKVDIENFFPSIHYQRVMGLFVKLGARQSIAQQLAALTTYRPKRDDGKVAWPSVLPQGAPTSPMVANLVCARLDARLTGLATKVGAKYTRYADDLTFSFKHPPQVPLGRFLWWVNNILFQEGFTENAKKRRILRPHNQQRITGIVVNEKVHIPREERRKFKAILHNCEKHGIKSQAKDRTDFTSYLLGYASFAHMVQPDLGADWLKRVRALVKKPLRQICNTPLQTPLTSALIYDLLSAGDGSGSGVSNTLALAPDSST